MNDKIKQLAEQAGQGEPFHIPPEKLEKFAELIVRECADICWFKDYASGSECAKAIEKHFGVEE